MNTQTDVEHITVEADQTTSLSHHEVFKCMVRRFAEMSFGEGQDQILFLGRYRQVGKRRWVPNDGGNIIDGKLNLGRCQLSHSSERREDSRHSLLPKLHPRTVGLQRSKSSAVILLGSLPLLLTSCSGSKVNQPSFKDFFSTSPLIRGLI